MRYIQIGFLCLSIFIVVILFLDFSSDKEIKETQIPTQVIEVDNTSSPTITKTVITHKTITVSPNDTPTVPIKTSTDTPTFAYTATADTRLTAENWSKWALVPQVSGRAKEIYALGKELGNDPTHFSTIGDCQSEPAVFMGIYDTDRYILGEKYVYLEETIHQFKGSFSRDNVTVKDGLSVASVLSPAWADKERCEENETPLECEIRIHRPVIIFINLGTNWRGGGDIDHEKYMRMVVDYTISQGVVPILSSKGDNLEGDHRINRSIARVGYDYDIPFWNFWRSIRDLPGKGIDDTREGGYLTTAAWGRRSFTGLQALHAVFTELNK